MKQPDRKTWVLVIGVGAITAIGVGVLFWMLGDNLESGPIPYGLVAAISAMTGALVASLFWASELQKSGRTGARGASAEE